MRKVTMESRLHEIPPWCWLTFLALIVFIIAVITVLGQG